MSSPNPPDRLIVGSATSSLHTPSFPSPIKKPSSFAAPLSDTYQQRLRDLHQADTANLDLHTGAAAARTYARQKANTITVYWWTKVSVITLVLCLILIVLIRMILLPIALS